MGRPSSIYSVYYLVDPRDGVVRYVGCTESPDQRLYTHIATRNTKSVRRDEWILDLLAAGLKPEMKIVFQTVDSSLALQVEKAHQKTHANTITNRDVYRSGEVLESADYEGLCLSLISELEKCVKALNRIVPGDKRTKSHLNHHHDFGLMFLIEARRIMGLPYTKKKRFKDKQTEANWMPEILESYRKLAIQGAAT